VKLSAESEPFTKPSRV